MTSIKTTRGNASIFAYPPCTMSPVSMPLSILYASLRIRNIIWAILRATWNKRWSDASKAANKLEGEPANAAMTQALVDAFTELRVATVLMHGIVPAGCELICEYFNVDPVTFFSWDNIFASTDEFVESLGEKPGEHRVKPLPPRFDFFSKHESQY